MTFCESGGATRVVRMLVRENEPLEAVEIYLALLEAGLDFTARKAGVDHQSPRPALHHQNVAAAAGAENDDPCGWRR